MYWGMLFVLDVRWWIPLVSSSQTLSWGLFDVEALVATMVEELDTGLSSVEWCKFPFNMSWRV